MRDSVPSASYSSVCNVLRQWNIPLIPTYRVYRLYDYVSSSPCGVSMYVSLFDINNVGPLVLIGIAMP